MPRHDTLVLSFPTRTDNAEDRRPASRASWTGQLTMFDYKVPVKAFAASVATQESHLCQIHTGCGQRIQQRKCCPDHGELTAEQVGKGYTYLPDKILELSEPELQTLKPDDDKTIRLTQFFDPADFDLSFLSGRTFYLVPAHPAAGADYATINQALQSQDRWGLGTMVLSGRRQLVIGRAQGGRLLLHLLHWPAQTRACPIGYGTLPQPTRRALRALETAISNSLTPIVWDSFTDDWESRLTAVVQGKFARRSAARPSRGRGKTSRRRNGEKTSSRRSRSPDRAANAA